MSLYLTANELRQTSPRQILRDLARTKFLVPKTRRTSIKRSPKFGVLELTVFCVPLRSEADAAFL